MPFLKAAYDFVFQFFDYTRNGLFFALVFLLLGAIIARQERRTPRGLYTLGLLVSSILLLAEGLYLHHLGVQRHDSMYVLLLPVMFFLFEGLLWREGRGGRDWRIASMLVYLVHPLCIILVRGSARITGLGQLQVEHNVPHFLAVAASSFVLAELLALLLHRSRRRKSGAHCPGASMA